MPYTETGALRVFAGERTPEFFNTGVVVYFGTVFKDRVKVLVSPSG